jgi:Methyltransferase domain/Domain of unknown function (DUF4214)
MAGELPHNHPKESPLSDEEFVTRLYQAVLRRQPSRGEIEGARAVLAGGVGRAALFEAFTASDEYRHLASHAVTMCFPPGHYYSPIVDPSALGQRTRDLLATRSSPLPAVNLNLSGQKVLFHELSRCFERVPFGACASPANRYYYDNPFFSCGDAIILFSMIGHLKPRRIIEVGSGFSSACILDTIDAWQMKNVRVSFIDPDTDRLDTLLRPEDRSRVEVIRRPLQELPLTMFTELQAGDILFMDSSHVVKTGSDVSFAVFDVLPSLSRNVMIHFHDCFLPFEYPAEWVLAENRSWNELYFLRAFLMYNPAFAIRFFNDAFVAHERALVAARMPEILKNTGSSLWIEKQCV